MRNRTLADLDRVVALGGGHGLGRVLSSLSSLGSRLTGIVTTTDNGGSTGRIRRSEGGIAWGDTSNMVEYDFCHDLSSFQRQVRASRSVVKGFLFGAHPRGLLL